MKVELLVAGLLILMVGCSPQDDQFKGTWVATSTSPSASISKLVIDDSLVHEVTTSGHESVLPYKVVNHQEAVANGVLGASIDLQLTGPNTLHMSDPDTIFQRT